MSESLNGFSVAATRQNAGSCLNALFCCAATRPVAGNENSPAPTDCANVIVAFSNESDLRLSHGAACAAGVRMIMIVKTAKKAKPTFRPTVAYSYFGEMVEVQCVAL
jgi:hypothetical protein